MPHELSGKPQKVIGADMFSLNNNNYLCLLDYDKFSVIIITESLSAMSIIFYRELSLQNTYYHVNCCQMQVVILCQRNS